jgi:hypothetical protein
MRCSSSTFLGVVAAVCLMAGCSPEAVSPPDIEQAPAASGIITSFDRLTLPRGTSSSFRASQVGAGARLSSSGITVLSRAPSVASVTAAAGRMRVEALGPGRTWVVVQGTGASDSVEVIVGPS